MMNCGRMRVNNDELRASIAELRDVVRANHDSLHANLAELFESIQRHDDQIAANSRQISELLTVTKQDAEAIRALVRIAEIHERRISGLEGEQQ